MDTPIDPQILEGLRDWSTSRWGAAATLGNVGDLGGHSGKTLGFTVLGAGDPVDLVVRIAPPGIKYSGSTDVLRQAPLLRALFNAGIKVAEVIDATADERFFGSPYLVVTRLAGRPAMMGPDYLPAWLKGEDVERAGKLATDFLAQLHGVDHSVELSNWEAERSPQDEIIFWVPIFERCGQEQWKQQGESLRERLLASVPEGSTIGVCHGDFQTNNILFTGEGEALDIGGVVDWEVAHIGAVELDLAWFLMMNDPDNWDPVELRGGLDLGAIVERYELQSGRRVQNLDWYRAVASYRMAAIAAYNIRLHRSGRKPDPAWERVSSSMARFFDRAAELLDS